MHLWPSMPVYVTEKSVKAHELWIVYELGLCMPRTSQNLRTLIIFGGFINNHERHAADLPVRANTASAERKAPPPEVEGQARYTFASKYPMKEVSAIRAVAWCSESNLNDLQNPI